MVTNAPLEFLGDVFEPLHLSRYASAQGMNLESLGEGHDGGDVLGQHLDGGGVVPGEPGLGVETRLGFVSFVTARAPEVFGEQQGQVVGDLLVLDDVGPELQVLEDTPDRAVSLPVESGNDHHGTGAEKRKES